ncbi:hypothetical protein [Streptomyces eurythermus]
MPDIEAVLNPWAEALTGHFAGAETPDDLETRLPVIRIARGGGGDDMFTGHPRIYVDVFAATADEARTLANSLRDALIALRGPVGGAVIRGVRCDSGPSRRPWSNEAVYRRGATYTVDFRAA